VRIYRALSFLAIHGKDRVCGSTGDGHDWIEGHAFS
jgi:hypothetical protein